MTDQHIEQQLKPSGDDIWDTVASIHGNPADRDWDSSAALEAICLAFGIGDGWDLDASGDWIMCELLAHLGRERQEFRRLLAAAQSHVPDTRAPNGEWLCPLHPEITVALHGEDCECGPCNDIENARAARQVDLQHGFRDRVKQISGLDDGTLDRLGGTEERLKPRHDMDPSEMTVFPSASAPPPKGGFKHTPNTSPYAERYEDRNSEDGLKS